MAVAPHHGDGGSFVGAAAAWRTVAATFFALLLVASHARLACAQLTTADLVKLAPGETTEVLQRVCSIKELQFAMRGICDPGAAIIQRTKEAPDATIADLDGIFPYPNPNAALAQVGDRCEVRGQDMKVLDTNAFVNNDNLTKPRAVPNMDFFMNTVQDLALQSPFLPYPLGNGSDGDGDGDSEVEGADEEGGEASRQMLTYDDKEATYSLVAVGSARACDVGLQCSLESVTTADNGSETYAGTCGRCRTGYFCPVGTLADVNGLVGMAVTNLCPRGYFCPNPRTIKDCPAGGFCPTGSNKPWDCNDISLDAKAKDFQFNASLKGNFCPENSFEPWKSCPPGYYCPNATVAVPCPKGYYCKRMATVPHPCPLGSKCPAMSVQPIPSWMIAVGFVLILIFVYGTCGLVLYLMKRSRNGTMQKPTLKDKTMELICEVSLPKANKEDLCETIKLGALACVDDPLQIAIEDLTISMAKRKILNNVNMVFPYGSLNAIFGPSGAGKTTIIKSTLGKLSQNLKVQGEVTFIKCTTGKKHVIYSGKAKRTCMPARVAARMADACGIPKARREIISMNVGYVPQDNVIYQDLTVEENILYSIKLRNKKIRGNTKRMTDQIIKLLGLTAARHTVAGNPERGGISGGEGRRVSIGLELAGSPSCLILDEPTTGLDTVSADRVLKCLNCLTKSGMTIVASIHQPKSAIFHLFDHVHLLMRGGHVVYTGPKGDTLSYFANAGFMMPALENPADFIIDIVSGLIHRKGHDDFTTAELPALWLEHGSSSNREGTYSPVTRMSPKNHTQDEFQDLLDMMTNDLQLVCSSHPKLNTERGTSYNLTTDEIHELVLQICATACHMNYYEDVHTCLESMSSALETYIEEEFPDADIDELSDLDRESLQSAAHSPSMALPTTLSVKSRIRVLSTKSKKYGKKGMGGMARGMSLASMLSVGSSFNAISPRLQRIFGSPKSWTMNAEIFRDLTFKDAICWVRSLGLKSVDIFTTAAFALLLGLSQSQTKTNITDQMYMSLLSVLYMGIFSTVASITFMTIRLKAGQREAGAAVSSPLIYTSAMCSNVIDHVVRPLVYCVIFYYSSLPSQTFGEFVLAIIGVALSTSGLGYIIAVLVPESLAVMAGLIIVFVLGTLLSGFTPLLTDLPSPWITFPSFGRWGIEAVVLKELEFAIDNGDLRAQVGVERVGYKQSEWVWCIVWLYASAIVQRVIAFLFFRRTVLL